MVEAGSLDNISIFEKPKYAVIFNEDNTHEVYELLGVGRSFEYEKSEYRKEESITISKWCRFLFIEYGVLWPLKRDNITVFHNLPTKEDLEKLKKYLDAGGEPSFFSTIELDSYKIKEDKGGTNKNTA